MKYSLAIISIFWLVAACNQSNSNKEKSNETVRQSNKIGFQIIDSVYNLPVINHYNITADTTYFFDNPDSSTQRREFLVKGESVEVIDEKNGFFLVDYEISDGKHMIGWLKSGEMVKMLFTPPKVQQ